MCDWGGMYWGGKRGVLEVKGSGVAGRDDDSGRSGRGVAGREAKPPLTARETNIPENKCSEKNDLCSWSWHEITGK